MNLSEHQEDIITGNLLGDGSLLLPRKATHNSYFIFSQQSTKREYVEHIHASLAPFSLKITDRKRRKPTNIGGKISHDIENWNGEYCYASGFNTVSNPVFTKLRKKWYVDKCKIVPKDLELNWQRVAVWFMDDGQNKPDKKEAYLFTNNFSVEEVGFLISKLTEMKIICFLNFKSKKPIIRISPRSYFSFMSNLKEFVIPCCMRYKITTLLQGHKDGDTNKSLNV